MNRLQRSDLYSLEEYAEQRPEFRTRVIAHKKDRIVHIGPYVTVYFEDRLTIQYQIQEMLRIERIFEPAGIEEELSTYNPLIPDGSNWKATFMIEVPDAGERKKVLAKLIGIEDRVWVQVDGHSRVYAIADEDIERENEEKTSSVHFLRFELSPEMVSSASGGSTIGIGIDHDDYRQQVVPLEENFRRALVADLQ